ncbi:asparaginase [Cupriavidus sp. EM10]|jgi:L-asparaginase|nr:asparaginase [Cupriavidus sp. EM10]MCA3182738.1 asparaginase [Cupriavidus sp.]MCA3189800.1 asparaginase [Cupriavidus sp.]MCA3196394.1 asparaginase [Cupriavidus sp.]MCA3202139.1 asparaginase [Cupriavidus sp.]MCA3232860.1 asparaginase [Cupriavidus sp.]
MSASPSPSPTLPRVVVLATGGTIAGSSGDPASSAQYQAATVPVSQLVQAVPALADVARIEAEQVAQVDSKDMTFGLWQTLAARVAYWCAQPDVAGIVITHGTDTLEETAMFLHLTQPCPVPVVITAAMRPATSLSADGPLNLLDAVRVAASADARGKGVLVVLNQQIHAGRDVTKAHTSAVDAFVSPATGPLGYVQDAYIRFTRTPARRGIELLPVPSAWPAVEIVVSHAQPGRVAVDALVSAGVKGMVVAATGNGSVHETLAAALADAAGAGVAVVRSSRTGAGHVSIPSRLAPRAGAFVSAGDLNPWKARVLLLLALAADPGLGVDAGRLQALFAAS